MALSNTSTPTYASTYGQHSQHAQASDALIFVNSVLQPQCGSRLLDFGCGTGNVTVDLARRIGPDGFLVGVDPDEERIKIAKKRFEGHDNVKIVYGSIDEAEAEAPYDVINANHVVHWISAKEHEGLLRKVYRSLRPGGTFGFNTLHGLTGFIRDLSASQYENSYDSFVAAIDWSLTSLFYWNTLLKKVGFEVIYGVEEERISGSMPNERSLLEWWEATCLGHFRAAEVTPEALDTLMKKHSLERNEAIPIKLCHVDVVARKPSSGQFS